MTKSIAEHMVHLFQLNWAEQQPSQLNDVETDPWFYLRYDERQRALRLQRPQARLQFIHTRVWLKRCLQKYCGGAAEDIDLAYTSNGKPYLAKQEFKYIQFNLSHSGIMAILGITSHRSIGIDIEQIKPNRDHLALAQRYFSPKEQAWLAAQPLEAQMSAFFQIWVRKEAWLKALGKGITVPLEQMETHLPDAPVFYLQSASSSDRWLGMDIPINHHYKAAIVLEGDTPFNIHWITEKDVDMKL